MRCGDSKKMEVFCDSAAVVSVLPRLPFLTERKPP